MKKLAWDLWVVLLDIVAVNASYYLALLIRFYVNFTLRPVAVNEYLPAWITFTPWYTIAALLIFMAFRLYGGMWRYAGVNDMNRIIGASLATTVVHILGTVVFVCRMPIIYYVIGGLLQFAMVVSTRFAYRVLLTEKNRISRGERVPCVVVGTGELGRKVIKHLENGGVYKTVAVVGPEEGRMLDGIPVVRLDRINTVIEKAQVLFIADPLLTAEKRKTVRQIAGDRTIQDYTGYQNNMAGRIPLATLLSVSSGTMPVVSGKERRVYTSPNVVLNEIIDWMDIEKILNPEIVLKKPEESAWDAWAEAYSSATGQDVGIL